MTRYNATVTTVAAGALAQAYTACEALARSHYENFPVASMLLPKAMRPHVAAVYAFARRADDIADEGTAPGAVRRAALDEWLSRLHENVEHVASGFSRTDNVDDLMLAATAHSIRTLGLPLSLFDDLVSAFAQDTTTTRYASWSGVLDYCRRSANPVGRLVLRIAGYQDPGLDRSSDALCTALQLTNFWQDFGRDWRAGRLYVPGDVQAAVGADERQLSATTPTGLTDAWGRAIERCVAFTRERFADGRAVCDGVRGRLRWELRLTWLGGSRILDRVERDRLSLMQQRPALGAADAPLLLMRALTWGPPPPGLRRD
jgi:squalene synthase HpnC